MTTATLAYFTDEQHCTVGMHAEETHMTHAGFHKGLVAAGIGMEAMLGPDDMNHIMFHAMVLDDDKIAMEIFGATEPTEDMQAVEFVRKLHYAMRSHGKQAQRNKIVKLTAGARVACFVNKHGGRLVIHPAVRQDATTPWQLTTISYDGVPSGHNNPPTFEEACYRAVNASEDYYWNESGYEFEWADILNTKAPI